jgi:glycosyltransferase involved in cell wall biosynthesis
MKNENIDIKKIGICINTYNRKEYYTQCISSIDRNKIGKLVIVNDGIDHYVNEFEGDKIFLNNTQLGVGKSKNIGLRYLIEQGMEYIFIIEDDILIKNNAVFLKYIEAANTHGIHHLCFEKVNGNETSIMYENEINGIKINFYKNPQGAFMYIHSALIKKLGFFDEDYTNAFEHIDFAYNLVKHNVAPPFWYFPDISNSEDYLLDNDYKKDSTITGKPLYNENLNKSAKYFIEKWGHFTNQIPIASKDEVIRKLNFLQNNYQRL